jgi:hypothetical protein
VYLISVTRGAHSSPSGQYINKLAPLVKCVVVTVRSAQGAGRRAVRRELERAQTVRTNYGINFALITFDVAVIRLV